MNIYHESVNKKFNVCGYVSEFYVSEFYVSEFYVSEFYVSEFYVSEFYVSEFYVDLFVFCSYSNCALHRYMEKHKIKAESKAFYLVSSSTM